MPTCVDGFEVEFAVSDVDPGWISVVDADEFDVTVG